MNTTITMPCYQYYNNNNNTLTVVVHMKYRTIIIVEYIDDIDLHAEHARKSIR